MKTLLPLCLVATTLAFADPVVVPAGRLVLLDGRVLKNAVIRSYDENSSKALVLSEGKAQLIPVDLLPPPLVERAKAQLSRSTDLVQTTAVPPADGSVAKAPAPASPAITATKPPPASPAVPEPARVVVVAEPADPRLAHREAARAHVLRYYKYEHRIGSNAVTVTGADVALDDTEPVAGWSGRYRTTGKVYLEAYDSYGGGSFRRTTQKFEVLTEQKPGEEIKVVDLTRK